MGIALATFAEIVKDKARQAFTSGNSTVLTHPELEEDSLYVVYTEDEEVPGPLEDEVVCTVYRLPHDVAGD